MKDLSGEEERWLEVFTRYNPFFEDILKFFSKNNFLTEKQYEQLEEEIVKFEEDGNYILDKADFRFLKDHSEENEDLREILEIYKEDGFLDDSDFNKFFDIKLDLNPEFEKREITKSRSESDLQSTNSNGFIPDTTQKKHEYFVPKKAIRKNAIDDDIKEAIADRERNIEVTYPKVCPRCNKKLVIYIGKNGAFFGCNGYPNCKFSFNIESIENILCPDCGSPMVERTGSRGIFLGCGGFPECRFTYPIRISKSVKSSMTPVKIQTKKLEYDRLETPNKFTDDNILNKKTSENVILKKRETIFVLKLENNKWWVGRSKNPSKLIAKHKRGKSSVWTRENRMIKIEETIEDGDLNEVTLRYMKNFGWQSVRGTSFNDSYYIYIPKKIKEYIKSQEGGLEYFKEKEDQTGPKDVYVLQLENGKWYVGKTSNVKRRVEEMKMKGNEWTQLYNIVALKEVRENANLKEVTLEYMRRYGWENVRGYAWSQWNMKYPPKELR